MGYRGDMVGRKRAVAPQAPRPRAGEKEAGERIRER